MSSSLEVTLQLTDEQLDLLAARVANRLAPVAAEPAAWLDAAGAAAHLSTSKERIYDLVQLGKLPAHRDGRRLLFKPSDLDAYVKASR